MKIKSKIGLTLVELIVAIAILGIVFIAFQDIFYNGYRAIFSSGQRTQAMMDIQEIADDIGSQKFNYKSNLEAYITNKGILIVSNQNDAKVYQSSSVNCFIGSLTKLNGVDGYPVELILFFSNHSQYVQMTVFVIPKYTSGG
jgi:prepilin-type N-terminal cleavage/methylation domain-containing protein